MDCSGLLHLDTAIRHCHKQWLGLVRVLSLPCITMEFSSRSFSAQTTISMVQSLLCISIAVLVYFRVISPTHTCSDLKVIRNSLISQLLDGYETSAVVGPSLWFYKNRTVILAAGWYTKSGYLTRFHALIILFRRSWSVVGFVDGCPEALVAAPPSDDTGARPVEGEVPVKRYLGNRRLEALKRAGLL